MRNGQYHHDGKLSIENIYPACQHRHRKIFGVPYSRISDIGLNAEPQKVNLQKAISGKLFCETNLPLPNGHGSVAETDSKKRSQLEKLLAVSNQRSAIAKRTQLVNKSLCWNKL